MTSSALVTHNLGKRYGSKWALRNCEVNIPSGGVCALVGPNGAGKTTLLQLAAGLLRPTSGSVSVLGSAPAQQPGWLSQIGYLAQETPLYRRLTADQLLGMGRRLNPGWDDRLARGRLEELGLPLHTPVGRLSGGERAQVALALALGKRPRLLLLDEPVASLDPVARMQFLSSLATATTQSGLTVVLSSHLIADIERVCDYLVILSASRVVLAGEVQELLAAHRVLIGANRPMRSNGSQYQVISQRSTARQTTMLVRINQPVHDPWWTICDVSVEELVLAYMTHPAAAVAGPGSRGELHALEASE
jgi:ABC-2 type transport system ATP-binding protein